MNMNDSGTLRDVRQDIERILIDRDRIAERVSSLAAEISSDFDVLDETGDIVLIPVMTGAVIFVADLIRQLPQKIRIHVISASSYLGKTTTSSGDVSMAHLPTDLTGRHAVIVDDILDSGTTVRRIRAELERSNATSVRACVLLRKTIPSALETPCEYVGFDIPDEFVVGYGLDYDGFYRNLPDIGVPRSDAL